MIAANSVLGMEAAAPGGHVPLPTGQFGAFRRVCPMM